MDKRRQILVRAMQEPDAEVKKSAALAIERLDVRAKLPVIEEFLLKGQKTDKLKAVYAISMLRGPKVFELLVKALKDDIEDVRASAARVLGDMGDKSVLSELVEALKDQSVIVEREVIEALSKFREPLLVPPLLHMLKSKDPGVIERALEAISFTADKRSEEAMLFFAVKGNNAMKATAMRVLGMMEP